MKFWFKAKDGGNDSKVTGYWLIESKRFGSIVLLRFDRGFREAYHTHAFHAVSWILKGKLIEYVAFHISNTMTPSFVPIFTSRNRFHMVEGVAKTTWALSIRGPWKNLWKEYIPATDQHITLTHGRKAVP